MAYQDGDQISRHKRKLKDEIETANITWGTVANARFEERLWEGISTFVAKDGAFDKEFRQMFRYNSAGEQRRRYLHKKYPSFSLLGAFLGNVVGVVAKEEPHIAGGFIAALQAVPTRAQGPSNLDRGSADTVSWPPFDRLRLTSDKSSYHRSSHFPAQQCQHDTVDPRVSLTRQAQHSRTSMPNARQGCSHSGPTRSASNTDPFCDMPELEGDDQFIRDDDDDDDSGTRQKPAGTGRPFDTWGVGG